MPNWCENRLYIEADESEIQNLLAAIAKNSLLDYMRPQPDLPEGESGMLPSWYTWRVDHWGTKWDVEAEVTGESPTHLMICFDSAWSPPIEAIRHWHAQDETTRSFNLRYIEWGMAFCGEEDSDGISYRVNIPLTVEAVQETIPIELDNEFDISGCVADMSE